VSVTDKLLDAMKGMMELNSEVRNLSKRVDRLDDQANDFLQRIARLETFVEIADKQKRFT
jgi:uncharacterized coiled-coil DUF342 family protein